MTVSELAPVDAVGYPAAVFHTMRGWRNTVETVLNCLKIDEFDEIVPLCCSCMHQEARGRFFEPHKFDEVSIGIPTTSHY